ncbi:MAG: N-acetylmuramoyl-L-alanine amidase [Solirubrobacterales bacterium]|nr:N-acetylmuramoyl-L-alanine amidase [Solirubrobacterales bacterium]
MAAAVFAVAAASFLLAGGQAGGSQSGWTRTLYSGLPETHERVGKTPAWIHRHFIPFGAKRKHQMARYSLRHYGVRAWRLKQPKQIVEHVAVAGTVAQVIHAFAPDRPDPEFHELPNVCAHFVVSGSGRVVQLVPTGIRCRHVVGLNHVAIGIEHTGYSDGDVLGNRRQMRSSIRLTKWLRCRYGIGVRDVIGHNESLSSRFYRELVPAMRGQTHGDFRHSSMRRYRKALHDAGRCPRT